MKRWAQCCAAAIFLAVFSPAQVQVQRDVLGVHDLSNGATSSTGANSSACLYCHAPHSGDKRGPLWSRNLDEKKTYGNFYSGTSTTMQNTQTQPTIGESSTLCLSCHDGTLAVGQTIPYGSLGRTDKLTDMQSVEASHPFSLVATPPNDAPSLVETLHSTGQTSDQTKAVQLIKNNVECTSCHTPHQQFIDKYSQNFLVLNNQKGALCLSCHTAESRTVKGINNPLVGWETSVHSTTAATYRPSVGLGGYPTVADSACMSCHMSHNAAGAKGLLRTSTVDAPNADDTSKSCINCHNGGSDKLSANIADIYSELSSSGKKSHPFPSGDNTHSSSEPVVLEKNRHASCVDCHNPHASKAMTAGTFNAAPGLRPSQFGVMGAGADGSVLTNGAVNQYENCLRCHGNGSGKQKLETTFGYLETRASWGGDELNLILQFGSGAISSHPVMRDASPIAARQPSLLTAMWDINGTTPLRSLQPGPVRIFCTDCHNNDQAREVGGTGPNGPHGSMYDHILERDYVASKVNEGAQWPNGGPGTQITNPSVFPSPYPNVGGPYSLCAKCHDLNNVYQNRSFAYHSVHLNDGISCSVCHTAHGVPSGTSGSSGTRLINFDVRVVAPNGTTTAYNSDGTCSLTCHMVRHYASGGVQQIERLTVASPRPF